ncbi:MAG: elongation factor Ts [Candidatus Paceibacterota bacterium]|jgi:elongation factor Ts
MITTEQIKELRDITGVSVMQCKKALEEAGGDKDKAILILKKKSRDVADKKSGRTLGAGAVQAYIHASGTVGAMVEIMSETDFVAKNEEFKKMAYDIAMHVAATNPEYLRTEDIPEEATSAAREMFGKEVDAQGKKDDAMREKILIGKLNAYFAERVLLSQPFVKNSEVTISGLLDQAVQKFGEKIELSRFVRFSI